MGVEGERLTRGGGSGRGRGRRGPVGGGASSGPCLPPGEAGLDTLMNFRPDLREVLRYHFSLL